MKSESKKKAYTKPVVLAATKKNVNFSAGCKTQTGAPCWACRCS